MRLPPKRVARVLLAAFMALSVSAPFLVLPSTAGAQVECWKRLLNDWYDGQIQNTYPIPCYQQAINHLPTDVEQYSSARDDITRALQVAVAAQNSGGTTTGGSSTPPATTAPVDTTETPTTETPTTETTPEPAPTTTPATNGRPDKKGIAAAIDKLNPSSADAFPLPLLVLGALAIALVIAGVVGMLWRRAEDDTASMP